MMPEFCVIGRPDKIRREFQNGIGVEIGGEPFLRQFDAIAFDARKADFKRVALRPHGFDLDRLARRLRRGDDGLGREVEGDAEDVGIFHVEELLFIEVVGLAAEGAANDLLAEKLRAEGADAENVGNGVCVPAFREHGNRDDAADGTAQLSRLADGVHDFAQQFLVGDVVRRCAGRRCAR